ncbi:MAG: small multi-drug export protein [Dehalococcoidia bacterium]|nr:small multi-drug export protein [Dehalococcoidia bacterium]
MEVVKLVTVLGIGAVELWAAIPAGFALGLHPAATGITAAIGAMVGVLIVMILGNPIRTWLVRKHSATHKDTEHGRIYRIWNRYGVVGLGLLAPLLTGAALGTALGVTLGTRTGRLLFWMAIGIVLWSGGLTLAIALGLGGIAAL